MSVILDMSMLNRPFRLPVGQGHFCHIGQVCRCFVIVLVDGSFLGALLPDI